MLKLLVKVLGAGIDLLLIYIPCYIFLEYFGNFKGNSELFAQLLFVVYNIVALLSFERQTVGKYFAKQHVYNEELGTGIYLGIRESAKLLYFLPFIGIMFSAVSLVLWFFTEKTLHDWLSQSRVVMNYEYIQLTKGVSEDV